MTIRGRIEGVHDNRVIGWAAAVDERSGLYRVVAVEAMVGDQPVGRGRADRLRAELKREGIGAGGHGFEIQLPTAFRHTGPVPLRVRAIGAGVPVELGTVVVFRGETSPLLAGPGLEPPPGDADLDIVLGYIRSVSHSVVLAHAEEVQAELGHAALVAYLFGRLLERMPDREAYESYQAALTVGALDARGLLVEIVQSAEYRSREAQPAAAGQRPA
ncbi:MAG: hypothetical protein JO047_15755 [Alphaproteobacteria bacterium]|nr:hypothetical protein [Alphaproteobacteria bacterium]